MQTYWIDPLLDPRWPELLEGHPNASVFHTREWLEALHRTYGYPPVVLTTSPPGCRLRNGIALCKVRSWLTGNRLVSLPFSDDCEPLVDCTSDLELLTRALRREVDANGYQYVEIRKNRAGSEVGTDFGQVENFCYHRLDLSSSADAVFRGFHRNCIQRKIRRGKREGLSIEEGRSESLLRRFYRLFVMTRRRHRRPPQPLLWFRNLADCMGDNLRIRVASKEGQPVASILTLRHRSTMYYKYGCSDRALNKLGGMQTLLWSAVREAMNDGLVHFDMGRSDWDNPGILQFKDRWGARRSEAVYLGYPADYSRRGVGVAENRLTKGIAALSPDGLLTLVGRCLYRHYG